MSTGVDMIVVAVLLLLVVAAVVLFVAVSGANEQVQLTNDLVNVDWRPSVLVVFLLGALCLMLVAAALALLRAGARRSAARRKELKRLREAEEERRASQERHHGRGDHRSRGARGEGGATARAGDHDAPSPGADAGSRPVGATGAEAAGRAVAPPADGHRVVDLRDETSGTGRSHPAAQERPVAPPPSSQDDPEGGRPGAA
ncbi:hypothetical protein [Thalassiella azotivora]